MTDASNVTADAESPAANEGRWVVARECGCAENMPGTVDAVHYIFGPFPSKEAAEEFARQMNPQRSHVFVLWPSRHGFRD